MKNIRAIIASMCLGMVIAHTVVSPAQAANIEPPHHSISTASEKHATPLDSTGRQWGGIDGSRYGDAVRKTDRITYTDAGVAPQVSCDIVGDNQDDLIFISEKEHKLSILDYIPYGSDTEQIERQIDEQSGIRQYQLPSGAPGPWKATCVKINRGEKPTIALANENKVYIVDRTSFEARPTTTAATLPIYATYTFDHPVYAISSSSPVYENRAMAVLAGDRLFYFSSLIAKGEHGANEASSTWQLDNDDAQAKVVPLNSVYGEETTLGVGMPSSNTVYAISVSADSGYASKQAVKITGTDGSGAAGFGSALVGIGDVNDDDVDDFAVGAPHANHDAGAVAIIYGQEKTTSGMHVTVRLDADTPDAVTTDGTTSGTLLRQSARGHLGVSLAYIQHDGVDNPGALLVGRPDHEEHPGALMISTRALVKDWNSGLGVDAIPASQWAWFAAEEGKGDGGRGVGVVQSADTSQYLSAVLTTDSAGKVNVWTVDMSRQKEKTDPVEPLYPAPHKIIEPPAIKPIDTVTQKRWVGEFSNGLGSAIARGRCDVTGDGKPDLVTSSPMRSEWKFDPHYELSTPTHGWILNVTGQLQIIPYATAGSVLPDDSIITIHGPKETQDPAVDAAMGLSVSCLGDVNGDEIDDIAVGSHTMGKVWVLYGGPDIRYADMNNLEKKYGYAISMPYELGAAGYQVATVGDVNHDGLADVGFIVPNTPLSRGEHGSFGTALIVSGQTESDDVDLIASYDNPRVIWRAQTPKGHTLSAFNPVGDINGDGLQDYVLADFNSFSDTGTVPGRAWVVYGSTNTHIDLDDDIPGFTLAMPSDASYRLGAGNSLASLGDIDGDGFGDFVIGFDGGQVTNTTHGGIALVHGSNSATTTSLVRTIAPNDPALLDAKISVVVGKSNGDGFGWAVDALPERKFITVGAWGEQGNGAVYLLDGTKIPTGVTSIDDLDLAARRIDTDAHRARFGRSVAFIGDYMDVTTLAIGADGVVDDPAADEEGYSHAAHILTMTIDEQQNMAPDVKPDVDSAVSENDESKKQSQILTQPVSPSVRHSLAHTGLTIMNIMAVAGVVLLVGLGCLVLADRHRLRNS
ncbi:integrin alpha [Arcanobacterium phocae]|uniref:integrin alpha n=1 Tax=Arcanobacterium phocae TaxID=131112 RepID=UPI001C0ECC1B|nr:integrin alpha [Arcanobacterium phocae]